jgi:hypothetical protein
MLFATCRRFSGKLAEASQSHGRGIESPHLRTIADKAGLYGDS